MRLNQLKQKIVLFFMFATALAGANPFPPTAYAASTFDGFTPSSQAASWGYYNALSFCVSRNKLSTSTLGYNYRIKDTDAESGQWFKDGGWTGSNPTTGYAFEAKGANGYATDSLNCNDGTWIKRALTLWGYADGSGMVQALCDFGMVRSNGSKCTTGDGDLKEKNGNDSMALSTFQNAIKKKVYGGANPYSAFPKAARYIYELNAFLSGCLNTTTPSIYTAPASTAPGASVGNAGTASAATPSDVYVYTINYVDSSGNLTVNKYNAEDSNGKKRTDEIYYTVSNGSPPQNQKNSCQNLETSINNNAAAFKAYAQKNPGKNPGSLSTLGASSTTPAGATKPTCGSSVTGGLGWMLCPVIEMMAGQNDYMWGMVKDLLSVNPVQQIDPNTKADSSIYTAWSSIRNIANVLFVIFFMIIIFSQLSSVGITNYGIKKLLPRLIICAILVNVSFVIIQITVDIANIVGSSLYDLVVGMAPKISNGVATWESLITIILSGAGLGIAGVGLAGGITTAFWMVLPTILMSMLGLLAAVLTLIFRQAIIPILAILAPLAFVAYLLPNTEQWFKKWRDMFVKMLMMYPIAALIFAGCQFSAYTIIGTGSPPNGWNYLIGLIMMSVPLFTLPFVARQGGALLSGVAGALNKMAEKARNPISGFAKSHEDVSRANYRSNNRPEAKTAIGRLARKANRFNPARGLNRGLAAQRLSREADTESAKSEFKSEWGRSNNPLMGNGKAAIQRSQLAKERESADSLDDRAAFHGTAVGRQAIDRTGYAKRLDTALEHTAQTRQDNTEQGMALNERVKKGELRIERDKALTDSRVANSAGGQRLHQQVSEAKGQGTVDTKNIQDRYLRSEAGQAIEVASEHAGTSVEVAQEAIKQQAEGSPAGEALADELAFAKDTTQEIAHRATIRQGENAPHRDLKKTLHGLEQDISGQKLETEHEADITDEGKQRVDRLTEGNMQAGVDKQDSEVRVGYTESGQKLMAESEFGGKMVGIQKDATAIEVSGTNAGKRLDVEAAAGKGKLANQATATTRRLGETAEGKQIAASKSILQREVKHQEAEIEHMVNKKTAQGRELHAQALDDADKAKQDDLSAQLRQSKQAVSRDVKRNLVGLEKDVKSETRAIEHEASEADGFQRDERALADEDIAKTDSSIASLSYHTNAAYDDIRTAADTAAADADIAKDERQVAIDAASEGAVPVKDPKTGLTSMVDLGRIEAKKAGFTDAQIDSLQTAKQRKAGLASQSANYARETKKNYQRSISGTTVYAKAKAKTWLGQYEADGVTPREQEIEDMIEIPLGEEYVDHYDTAGNPVMATVNEADMYTDKEGKVKSKIRGQRIMPVTDAAVEAAKGDPNGIIRLQAQAEYEGDQQEREAVDQRKIRMASDLQPDELADVAYAELLRCKESKDVEGALAAQEHLNATGEKGHGLLIKYWLAQKSGEDMRSNVNRKLKNNLLSLGIRDKDLALDKLAIDRGGQKTLGEIMLTPPVDASGNYIPKDDLYKGLKGRQLLNQAMPMMYALYRNGTIDAGVATSLLTNPTLQDEMTPERKAFLEKVVVGDTAGLDGDDQFDNITLPDGTRPPMPPPRPQPEQQEPTQPEQTGPVMNEMGDQY